MKIQNCDLLVLWKIFLKPQKHWELHQYFFLFGKLDEEDFSTIRITKKIVTLRTKNQLLKNAGIDNESFDLTIALPSLADFKKRIGQEYQFLLMAKISLYQ